VLAHAFFPPRAQSWIPVISKELGHLLKMRVTQRLDILSQLVQSKLGMRFTVRIVKESHQLPDNMAEAVHKTFLCAFSCGKCLLFLSRYIAGLLEEAPTPGPSLLRQS
jgi:hypothetical protein